MSDALHVSVGQYAWMPVPDAVAGEVLDRWDVPRIGLLHHCGVTYLFQNLIGDGAQGTSLWAYSPLEESEISELLAAEGPEAFDELCKVALADRYVTAAIANDDVIAHFAILDMGAGGTVEILERIRTQIAGLNSMQDRLGDFTMYA